MFLVLESRILDKEVQQCLRRCDTPDYGKSCCLATYVYLAKQNLSTALFADVEDPGEGEEHRVSSPWHEKEHEVVNPSMTPILNFVIWNFLCYEANLRPVIEHFMRMPLSLLTMGVEIALLTFSYAIF